METLKIKRILIPMDFSETGLLALEHGALMAKTCKADLYVLHIIEMMEFAFNVYDPALMINEENDAEVEKLAKENMDRLSERVLKEYGLSITPLVVRGRIISGITEVAKDNDIDIIIMGTHGANGFEEYILDSNAHKTIATSPCPVITVPTHAPQIGFSNIILPIDNSLHSRQKVDIVIELASKYAAEVHILGLINSDEDVDENKFNIKIDSVEKVVKKAGLTYTRKIVKGKNIAVEAINYSNKVKADLIAIMTDHESHLKDIFLGVFSKQIVNHSQVPVISINPMEGFYEATSLGAAMGPYS